MTINWRTQSIRLAVFGMVTLLSTACGGRSTVVTQDDSADYRSARSLPPLKKPDSGPVANTQSPQPQSPSAASVSVRPTESVTSVEVPTIATPTLVGNDDSFAASASKEVASIEPQASPDVAVESDPPESIVSELIEQSNGDVVLSINAGAEESWEYLRNLLSQSDITVHTRNKSAGRFAVGCDGVDVPRLTDPTVDESRKGRWSFFKRKDESSVYCALQLVTKRSTSVVTAKDRSGQAVPADLARVLFARLLNSSR